MLPEKKTPPSLTANTAKGLIHGHPGVGKSTLAAGMNPANTLFIATEPGLGGLEVFQLPCGSWEDFLKIGMALAEDAHKGDKRRFKVVVVDTVDELLKFCSDFVCKKLGINHPSDLEYGKGWEAVTTEWRLRLAKLCAIMEGTWFLSHSVDKEIKTRVGSVTKTQPAMTGKPRDWLIGFVDFVFYAELLMTEDGEVRHLRTQPSENYEAKQRSPLPLADPLDMDPAAVTEALLHACPSSGKVKA